MNKKLLASALMTMGLSGLAINVHAAEAFGTNLIENPGAELGPGSTSGSVASIPGWTPTGNFTVVQYGGSGGFPTLTDPGPGERGANFFAGGEANAASSATQRVDITFASGAINGSGSQFTLSGWLGGFSSQGDNAVLHAQFLNSVGAQLSDVTIGPVSNSDRSNTTGLQFLSTVGDVPLGAESVQLTLDMTRLEGSYNDGYADNLSFVLSPVPEPYTYAMFIAGLGLMGFLARSKTQKYQKLA